MVVGTDISQGLEGLLLEGSMRPPGSVTTKVAAYDVPARPEEKRDRK